MRNLIARLMIVLVCMPLLVCAMPLCDFDLDQSEKTTHCGDQFLPDHESGAFSASAPMLIADCGGIVLASSASFHTGDKELKPDCCDGDTSCLIKTFAIQIIKQQRMGGLPYALSIHHHLPVYLATQRLRI